MKRKKGISLIVLVITIIVIIILAGAVILSLSNNNPINTASETKFKTDVKSFNDELSLWMSKTDAETLGEADFATLNSNGNNVSYNVSGEAQTTTMDTIMPSIKGTAYADKLKIVNGQLVYVTDDSRQQALLTEIQIAYEGTIGSGSDTTPPTVSYGANGGSGTSASTTVTVSDQSGITTLQYIWDTQNSTTPTGTWTTFTSGSTITKDGVTGTYYLWIKASDSVGNNVVTKTNAFVLTEPPFDVGVIANVNRTINNQAASYSNPIIPKGFKAINDGATWPTDWNKGLVIEDGSGNQFVWVPVKDGLGTDGAYSGSDTTTVKYKRWDSSMTDVPYTSAIKDTICPNASAPTVSTIDETQQVSTYGGFYIARYEASGYGTIYSKKSMNALVSGTYNDVKSRSESMYTSSNSTSVRSGLITGTQWDTAIRWIQNSGKSISYSTAWGNYTDSQSPADIPGHGTLQVTGYSEYWKANNIYDLAGNAKEYTNEKYTVGSTNYNVIRDGVYHMSGGGLITSGMVACRGNNLNNTGSNLLGFRVVLYII